MTTSRDYASKEWLRASEEPERGFVGLLQDAFTVAAWFVIGAALVAGVIAVLSLGAA